MRERSTRTPSLTRTRTAPGHTRRPPSRCCTAFQTVRSVCTRSNLLTLVAAYTSDARALVVALRDSISFEAAGGASEREVRRRADPAKGAVELFIKRWRGAPEVVGQPSYAAIVGERVLLNRVVFPGLTPVIQRHCASWATSTRTGGRAPSWMWRWRAACWPRWSRRKWRWSTEVMMRICTLLPHPWDQLSAFP